MLEIPKIFPIERAYSKLLCIVFLEHKPHVTFPMDEEIDIIFWKILFALLQTSLAICKMNALYVSA